jgi:hypothetical protein
MKCVALAVLLVAYEYVLEREREMRERKDGINQGADAMKDEGLSPKS